MTMMKSARALLLQRLALKLQLPALSLPVPLRLAEWELPVVHPWGLLGLVLRSPSRLLDRMTAAHHRYLDRVTARVTQNPLLFPHGFFSDGWGDLNTPRRLREVLQSHRMSEISHLQLDEIAWSPPRVMAKARVSVQEGRFTTTLPNAKQFLPKESLEAFCELVAPTTWPLNADGTPNKTLVLLLPGTGEHGFLHRRMSIGVPLAKRGVATLILEGPFYGRRRPEGQKGSKLRRVSDLPILGQATIEEAKSLLAYFQTHHGYTHVVVAGSSMGGLHAAMVASVYPGDVGATAWLAPPSAVPVFTEGLLAASCNWSSLYKQHELQLLDSMLQGQAVATTAVPQEASFEDEDPVQQAKKRMRMFLSITDIDNFHPPRRTDAVVFVVGTEDEYIGFSNPEWTRLAHKWRPAQFRHVKTGHVSGILLESEAFERTIMDVVDKVRHAPTNQE